MRVEGQVTADRSGLKGPASGVVQSLQLEEGQLVNAKVLSVENGTALLKTQEGYLLRAKLEAEVLLLPGMQTALVVEQMVRGVPVLKLESGAAFLNHALFQGSVMQTDKAQADKSMKPALDLLAAQNIVLTDESMELLQEVIRQNPGVSPERAAFITANRLSQSAAESLFSGVKAAQTLDVLIGLVEEVQPEVPAPGTGVPETHIIKQPEILTRFVLPENRRSGDGFQSFPEGLENERASMPADADVGAAQNLAGASEEARTGSLRTTPETGALRLLLSLIEPQTDQTQPVFIKNAADLAKLGSSGAGDGQKPVDDLPDKLLRYLKSLFADFGEAEAGDGLRLKKAKEELALKLTLLREAVSETEIQTKNAILELTQKLLNHMKAVNELEQFLYAQLPVQLSGESKTAELYIFKKKQSARKLDSDNVQILLALDLTHLGHVESLIGIKGKEVTLRFEVPGIEAENVIRQHTPALYKLLAEIGFKLANTTIARSREETVPETAMLRLLAQQTGMTQGLDLTI